ncbi:hypothetical protein [Streptomyces sp. NPDC047046]|uniref:hypothetical protein n=1 Tax=Streptomyces sp. NPDC047046 TaxID=3155378 RepID=UPI0033F0335C
MPTPYLGSGPYCYANSLVTLLGPGAPSPALVETLTGSAFGFQWIGGHRPFFDALGWDPEQGIDAALRLLGVACARTAGGGPDEALRRLRTALAEGPVLVGPVDMGLLLHQPGTPSTDGGDHYVVALDLDADGLVTFHDPHGHPWATLPAPAFLAAWAAETVPYTEEPYVMRHRFTGRPDPDAALRALLPEAARWAAGRTDLPVPPGTLGGAEGLRALAARLRARELPEDNRALLVHFGVRVGARRRADAAGCLRALAPAAAGILDTQARLVGALQYPLVRRDDDAAAGLLGELAPTYPLLRAALAQAARAEAVSRRVRTAPGTR